MKKAIERFQTTNITGRSSRSQGASQRKDLYKGFLNRLYNRGEKEVTFNSNIMCRNILKRLDKI